MTFSHGQPHEISQTTLLQQTATPKHPFEPWKDQPCPCVHCGKMFPNNASKNSHLMHCKKRFLNRYYKCERFLFTIQLNPIKRRRAALQKLIADFKNPQMLLGAIAYLMNEGIVRNYSALEMEDSAKMLEMHDGRILYSSLTKLMSPKELKLLEAQVTVLNEEKVKLMNEGVKI